MKIFDTVVVGAGAAGAYCLHRMAELGKDVVGSVCLVEATARTHGRVYSVKEQNAPLAAPFCELGAMRFMDHHILVRSLVQKFGLATSPHRFDTSFLHLRGRKIPYREGSRWIRGMSPRFDEIYLVDHDEQGRSPAALFQRAMFSACKQMLAENKSKSDWQKKGGKLLCEWLHDLVQDGPQVSWRYLSPEAGAALRHPETTLFGTPLYKIAFWNLLQHYSSTEAFHLIRDGLGYYSISSEWNAADALIRFMNELRPDGGGYTTLTDGMESLLKALFKSAAQELDIQPQTNRHLYEIRKLAPSSGATFELCVLNTEAPGFVFNEHLAEDVANPEETIGAKKLLLCLPTGAVRRIRFRGFDPLVVKGQSVPAGTALYDSLDASGGWPLQKIVLVYDSPWWNSILHQSLPSRSKIITDIAARQIYLDGSDPQRAVVMLYNDGAPVGAWEALTATPDAADWQEDECVPHLQGKGVKHGLVSKRMYEKLRRFFALLLEVEPEGLPFPKFAAMQTWGKWPQWAGWHAWRTGYQSGDIREMLAKPYSDLEFGICGEAFSTTQGWIEGAFKSAELVMLKNWNLQAPSWVPHDLLAKVDSRDVHGYVIY